jgi:predicted alpha/beta hydrolase
MTGAAPEPEAGRDLELTAEDGRRLAATLFMPAAAANNIAVQINSATGVPRRYYRAFASYLATRGFAVLTYDYRGIGGSLPGPLRRERMRALQWAEQDQVAATDFLRTHLPGRSFTLVGHSFGGQILGLSPHAGAIEAALLIGAPHGYWRHWSGGHRWRNALLWYGIIPGLVPLLGYFPGSRLGMSDLPAGFALDWARWCRSPHYICDGEGRALRPFNHLVRASVRQIRFTDDPIVPEAAARALLDYYPNADRRYDRLEPGHFDLRSVGHFGFFRRSMPRSAWADAAEWLAAHARG